MYDDGFQAFISDNTFEIGKFHSEQRYKHFFKSKAFYLKKNSFWSSTAKPKRFCNILSA
jgi:hypothetical protein